MTNVSVSLADGNINEGYVLGGYLGVVIGVAFIFALVLLGVRALRSSNVLFMTIGLTLVASPVLFERGILGSMEVLGKSLQAAVLLWTIDLVVRQFRARAAWVDPAPVAVRFAARTEGGMSNATR